MKKILIATDAWYPQVSGVVRTLEKLIHYISINDSSIVINPNSFKYTFPCPMYNEIHIAVPSFPFIRGCIDRYEPDHIHILTEGPIGLYTSMVCNERGLRYTTSLLTRFDKYIGMRVPMTEGVVKRYLRWFHSRASKTFVSTEPLRCELESSEFKNLVIIPKGVDTELFRPRDIERSPVYPRMLYVGRVAKEKNLEEFLSLDIDGEKVVVGDGPSLSRYKKKYPSVIFKGTLEGQPLAMEYSMADVFVFPSRTETYGLVITESMASGTPVAALPSDASNFIIKQGVNGYVSDNLTDSIKKCLTIDREECRISVLDKSWEESVRVFMKNLVNTH